jgi:nucleotide-binding universal stress UspA family protein
LIEINNILCPIDFSDMSPRVASYAQTLAKALNASVHVVFVTPTLDPSISLREYMGVHISPASGDKNIIADIIPRAEKKMDMFIQENFSMENIRGQVLSGYVSEEILNFAEREKIDLIIMGTHGRHGMDRILSGSVADKVVKASKIPVVTIRPEQTRSDNIWPQSLILRKS